MQIEVKKNPKQLKIFSQMRKTEIALQARANEMSETIWEATKPKG